MEARRPKTELAEEGASSMSQLLEKDHFEFSAQVIEMEGKRHAAP